jgi:hypothetical protein
LKYSKNRTYRDQIVVVEETKIVKKVKKQKEDTGILKTLSNLFKGKK